MKKVFALILPALFAFTWTSCDNDDDLQNGSIPEGVRAAFHLEYPSAQGVEWDKEGIYYVAEFKENMREISVWYNPEGEWKMTVRDIPFTELPEAVLNAFQSSEYTSWIVDDVEVLDRKGFERLYKIEAELNDTDIDLYYSETGILIKTIADNEDQHPSIQHIPEGISLFMQEKYPAATIAEMEVENGKIEIDIIHENRSKDIFFDLQYLWLYTTYDIRPDELPEAVVQSITNNLSYAGYRIDDA